MIFEMSEAWIIRDFDWLLSVISQKRSDSTRFPRSAARQPVAQDDYLGLKPTDVTDWRFVDFKEVPRGPWSTHGDNNTFVINDRAKGKALVERLGAIAR